MVSSKWNCQVTEEGVSFENPFKRKGTTRERYLGWIL
jgi:hypothetical protein